MTIAEYEGACRNIAACADDDWLRSELAAFDAAVEHGALTEETIYIRALRAEMAIREAAEDGQPTAPTREIGPDGVLVYTRTVCRKCRFDARWDDRDQTWRHADAADAAFCAAMFG